MKNNKIKKKQWFFVVDKTKLILGGFWCIKFTFVLELLYVDAIYSYKNLQKKETHMKMKKKTHSKSVGLKSTNIT